jgi:hypothetical protein
MLPKLLFVGLTLLGLTIQVASGQSGVEKLQTVQFSRGTKQYTGALLAEDADNYVLLQRDGRMKVVAREGSSAPNLVAARFTPFTAQTIADGLREEFGRAYEVSHVGNYLVVHPPGKSRECALPFEEQFIRSQQYFHLRGVATSSPDFPLVAVVLKTRTEFDRFLQKYQPENHSPHVVGYYSPRSNRTITYDQSDSGRGGETFSTLVHEATHQIAFNTGIHSRFAPMPRWFTEGLATMFEAPGIHNGAAYPGLKQRVNREWLAYLKKQAKQGQTSGVLPELISSDELFRSSPQKAYGYAWGLTFFLAELHPEKYAQYVKRVGGRGEFREYGSQQRTEDFVRVFGSDLVDLEARMLRYLADFK